MDHLKFTSTKIVQLTLDENGQLVDDCIKNVALRKRAKKLVQDKDDEQRLSHALKCKDQGSIRKCSFVSEDEIWSRVVLRLSDKVLKFAIDAVQNTLPHNVNLKCWNKSESDLCPLCGNRQTLLHVLNNCPVALKSDRYTWRHNSVLKAISGHISTGLKHGWNMTTV